MSSKDFIEVVFRSGPMVNFRGTVRYFGLRTVSFELLLNGRFTRKIAYPDCAEKLDRNLNVSVNVFPLR